MVTSRAHSGQALGPSGRNVGSASDTEEDAIATLSEEGEEYDSDASERKVSFMQSFKAGRAGLNSEVKANGGRKKKGSERKMGGLSLPDVVRELLKERSVLRWDPIESLYEVLNGEKFELRRVADFQLLIYLSIQVNFLILK